MDIPLGALYTDPVVDKGTGEAGRFEQVIEIDHEAFLTVKMDKTLYVYEMVTRIVKEQAFLTGVAIEYWTMEFDEYYVKLLQLPAKLKFRGGGH